MQVLKKIVSLLLVAAMISSLALVAFAADETGTATPNVVLEAYKADGSALGASESVKVGDTIKVKLKTTEALECVNMNIYVTYDSEVLEADKTNSKLGDIASRFMMKSANVATSNEDDVKQGLAVGTPVVLAPLSNPTGNVSVDANTEWAEFAFTVKSVSDATKLQVVIKTASRLNGIDPEAISSLVPGDLTLSVAGGASDNISKFEANGSTEVYATVGSRKMVKINYTTKDGIALAAEDVTWTSDNETVVSVSDASVLKKATATYVAFRVKPSSVGVAHVTGTIGNHSVTFTYKVFAELPVTIEITTESDLSMNVAPGKKIQMTAVTYPVTPAATSVWPEQAVWKSSNEAVATVDSNGLVTTVGAGKATITVTLMGVTSAGKTISVADISGGEYTVSMPEDQTVLSGSTVEIPVAIGSANTGVTKYNAYDMRLSYDPTQLELVTDALVGKTTTLEKGDGTVHVIHYGDVQDVNTTAFTLRFNVLAASGTATLTMTSAQVDISANALGSDAKNATLTKAATVLTVEVRHSVTLPEEMQGNNWVVSGTDYTFSVKNYDSFYNYTVTATMNGTAVSVIDNGDGTFTISDVSGDLVIAMNSVGKSYTVTFAGNGAGDIAKNTVKTATYGTPYEFTINKDDSYAYTVTAAIGEASVNVAASNTDGTYQIAGTEIKGNIVITITKELKNPDEVNVVVEGTGAKDVTADSKAAKGTDFIFKVKKESGYIYEVKITINGSEYSDATFVEAEDGIVTYTIPGTAITGMIVIEVTKDEAVNVTFENTNKAEIKVVKADGRTSLADGHDIVKKGADYVFKVNSFKRVYTLTVEVTENEQTKTYTEDIPVAGNSDTRLTHTITIPNVQGNLNIKLSCVANDDMVEVVVNPYVELDGKTVYIIATRTKEGYQQGIKLDTYDGYAMYTTNLYIGQFENPLTGKGNTFLWLTIVNEGEEFGKVQALQHLSSTNHRDPLDYNKTMPKPDGIGNDGDVNGSNLIDVNDAQLVYDIYKGAYQSFYMTNTDTKNDTHVDPNYGIGTSMTKFLEADVNRDMKVDIHDAADIINLIK